MASLQIRNMPEDAHRTLKARAAMAGQSLSEYALSELLASLARPTHAELMDRISSRSPVELPEGLVAQIIREERDAR
jgi:plasmid stability protein